MLSTYLGVLILQRKSKNVKGETTPHMRKGGEECRRFIAEEFGETWAPAVEASPNTVYWVARIPTQLQANWLWSILDALYRNPDQNLARAQACLKMVKPTYQSVGLRLEITLIGFLLQVEAVEPCIGKYPGSLSTLLEEDWSPHIERLIAQYRTACQTTGVDTWGTTKFHTWQIVVAFIEKILPTNPRLKRREVLNLARGTNLKSLVAKGNTKRLEVIGCKNQKTVEFKQYADFWQANDKVVSHTYAWTNPPKRRRVSGDEQVSHVFGEQIPPSVVPVADDTEHSFMSEDEREATPTKLGKRDYFDAAPAIVHVWFGILSNTARDETIEKSDREIESITDEFLRQWNLRNDEIRSTNGLLYFETNGLTQRSVENTFDASSYDDLMRIRYEGTHIAQFDSMEKNLYQMYTSVWSSHTPRTFVKVLGCINTRLATSDSCDFGSEDHFESDIEMDDSFDLALPLPPNEDERTESVSVRVASDEVSSPGCSVRSAFPSQFDWNLPLDSLSLTHGGSLKEVWRNW